MFGVRLSKMGSASKLGLIAKAIGILRKYGTDAHVYLPGIGTVSGLTAGNYLDSAGVTAASVDNPVGLSLDALQAMTLGSELVTNGAFSTDASGWTPVNCALSVSSGELLISTNVTAYGRAPQAISTTSGDWYKLSFSSRLGTSSFMQMNIGTSAGASDITTVGDLFAGIKTILFKAVGSTTYITPYSGNVAGDTAYFSSISVKQIPGIHATQGTTANKPILRRGTLNLLLQSEDFSSASWTKTAATVTANATTDPLGGSTADKLISTAVANWHAVDQNVIPANTPVRFSVYAKAAEETKVALSDFSGSTGCVFDLSAVTATVSGTDAALTISSPSITSVGNGWYRCSVSMLATATKRAAIYVRQFAISFLGDGTSGIYVWGAQLEVGTTASDYSPTTTAAASNPNAGKYSWQFDGSNDSLSLSAPLFQPSDDHCIVGAATCKDAAGQLTIFSTDGNNGRTQFRFNSGYVQFLWLGTTGTNFISPISYTNIPIVVGARKVSSVKTSRINGATLNIDSTAVDTVTNSASTIGSWAGTNYMNGNLGPIIVIKGTVTDSDLLTLERFVGQLSGVSI